ncbi:hypothetical protein [Methylomonas rosea]|uniref:Uncharacterized protein n=1 Tax=Methylomonas rosea TaxID=2952227 RepID=A0ABT1TMZ2_9GAMM|nr:hypothetical protein [Methylomonas sp. WSC-7]MCQ8116129.1 hypothetical protein [Methylomonas sp. WSC-7]
MHIVVLRKNNSSIELLIDDNMDMSLITENANQLFECKTVFERALKDFLVDHSADINRYKPLCDKLQKAGVIGYPVTAGKDAGLYAMDRNIPIESQLEIRCE